MFRYSNSLVPQVVAPGLIVSVSAGVVFLSGANTRVSFPGGNVGMAPNTTNYVYLDLSRRIVTVTVGGFPNPSYPIAIVVTNGSGITALSDQRPDGVA